MNGKHFPSHSVGMKWMTRVYLVSCYASVSQNCLCAVHTFFFCSSENSCNVVRKFIHFFFSRVTTAVVTVCCQSLEYSRLPFPFQHNNFFTLSIFFYWTKFLSHLLIFLCVCLSLSIYSMRSCKIFSFTIQIIFVIHRVRWMLLLLLLWI